jgi:hypothetical protein
MKYLLLAIVTGVSLLFAMRTKAEITTETPDIQSSEDLPSMPVSSSNQTIAVRNNNPLNIRETSDNWQGLSSPRASKGFFNFTAPEYGFRAARVIIMGAYANRGVRSVSQIISTWAPKSENNTQAYIAFVEKDSGLRGNTLITKNNIRPLLVSMAKMESGKYWPSEIIDRSFQL